MLNRQSTSLIFQSLSRYELDPLSVTFTRDDDSVLGEGAEAIVFSGDFDGKKVAIKSAIKSNNSNKKYILANEKKILEALTSINAPNIVKYFGSYHYNHDYNLVFEYMAQGSLEAKIDTEKEPFSWSLRYQIMIQIADGLEFLHQLNIVHGDVKNGNILLDQHFNAKLADFSYAKKIDDTLKARGSVAYLAPELYELPQTAKSDVYSFAVVGWSLAAWLQPYENEHTTRMMTSHQLYLNVRAGIREKMPNHCPPKLAHLIRLGWDATPTKRPTAGEMSKALKEPDDEIIKQMASLTLT